MLFCMVMYSRLMPCLFFVIHSFYYFCFGILTPRALHFYTTHLRAILRSSHGLLYFFVFCVLFTLSCLFLHLSLFSLPVYFSVSFFASFLLFFLFFFFYCSATLLLDSLSLNYVLPFSRILPLLNYTGISYAVF